MCTAEEDKISLDTIFSKQFQFAWDHFKFHAEQRVRIFHFFLIASALFLNAFSFLAGSEDLSYQRYAFIVLCIGGFVSTMFFSLDIRNTQLLKMSEDLLEKIEQDTLYPDPEWRMGNEGQQIKLGILSREAVLNTYVEKKYSNISHSWRRWIHIDNIKHKFSIRFIEIFAIVCFWLIAIIRTPCDIWWAWIIEIPLCLVCFAWAYSAMRTPDKHQSWEKQALLN